MTMTIEPENKDKNNHAPNEKLRKYMNEKSHLMHRKKELDLRMESKKKLTKKEEEELQDIERRTRTLKNTKTEILHDIVFPAMADLTFFFYAISQDPDLESVFKANIMDLLGIRRLKPTQQRIGGNYAFMFDTLVGSMLNLGSYENDYTIRLVNILVELIRLKLYGPKILDTNSTTGIVLGDIARTQAWTDMLASRIPDVYNFTILTDPYYGEKEEDRRKAFEEHVSKRLPDRTFDFDTKKLIENK
jgi:hypothetical protein